MMRSELDETAGGNGHLADDLKAQASAKLDDALRLSEEVMDKIEAFVRERPATAILTALGAGYLIGRLVRRV